MPDGIPAHPYRVADAENVIAPELHVKIGSSAFRARFLCSCGKVVMLADVLADGPEARRHITDVWEEWDAADDDADVAEPEPAEPSDAATEDHKWRREHDLAQYPKRTADTPSRQPEARRRERRRAREARNASETS